VALTRLSDALPAYAAQATALIPADVPQRIADRYRLYLSLRASRKPVVTGTFAKEGFAPMRAMLAAVRGGEAALRERPLAIFDCCPSPPLRWSDLTCQALIDCARSGIPAEMVSMPLCGATGPATLEGAVAQHAAECLSGVVIHQAAQPGAPIIWGGSPAAFDMRHGTTPMGAIETMMIDCAYAEIGKALGIPTQAYMALSDAKLLDAQCGLETGMGATLAALAGVNSVSGPGMLDFESCFSLEKLVLDNEICGMALRLIRGIEPREDFPALPHFEELLAEKHLLISDHTRKYLKQEILFPGPAIDRANRSRWQAEGGRTLGERAHGEVERLLARYQPSSLANITKAELTRLMKQEAQRWGMNVLPHEKLSK
jgi:trimethylamine--corrinoid protein Co-methyltransferase